MKFAVLISGRGSNLQALIDASKKPTFPAEIVIVISNEANAKGIQRADDAGLPVHIINQQDFVNRSEFDSRMTEVMRDAGVELICLAGFMRVLSNNFVNEWWNKIINIHPSLLPAFKGLNVQSRVIASGAKFSGCTVHLVRQGVDEGPIICQAVVPIHENDNTYTLSARILKKEHLLYPMAVHWFARGQIRISDDRVYLKGTNTPNTTLINPRPKLDT